MQIIPLFVAIPLFGAFLIPMVSRKVKWFPDIWANITTLALLFMSLSTIGSTGIYEMGGWIPPLGINLVLDGLSVLMLVTVNLVSLMATLFSVSYIGKIYTSKLRYYSLFLLMVAGMNGVILTGDMFNLFVFLEIASIASYALVGFGCEHEELEASFKYLVLGCVASTLIILGVALTYGSVGSLNMADISQLIMANGMSPALYFTITIFLVGFGLKAALVPFHSWLPDAHPSAPAPISAMLSGVLIKVLGIYALMRIFFNVFGMTELFSTIFLALGALSMVIGVLLAIGQWDLKRLLAYHSISQLGYVMLGVGLGSPLGILGGTFHLVNHAIFKSLLFLDSGAVEYSTGTRQLKEMGGLSKKMPVTGTTSLIASFSIAGLPPFNGFWSKLIIIVAAVQAKSYMLALVACGVSILTLASFLKVQKYAFFGEIPEKVRRIKEVPGLMCLVMVFLALLCCAMGLLLLPGLRAEFLQPAVDAILAGTEYARVALGN